MHNAALDPYAKPAPTVETIESIVGEYLHLEGPLLPILHALQESFGHIPEAAIPVIAQMLNIGRTEVHGVVTFYHDFREAPAGRHVIKLCQAEACQAVGAEAIGARALAKLGVDWHGTTPDGAVTVEPVYCLGLCACGPAALVDGKVVGRVDATKIDAILTEANA
ncbi:formate dehydrogenase subunit gamma [Acuticoccus mangrovi]|uniref:Formate dehydrogenase subunit gamma n=1 Tax=Acuticoccus mangrovi TaxID=2796142 RepID=A0A934MHH9_9HYPH|nr:formate dehydrogenase subunit gamma [Acuticoccus mangrovi]MBJ3776965.1 formate dehydrogenase subunit gamma [Acuticoccus mangrovi]